MNQIEDDLNVNFVANAGVKDIVGRGLIYNDNVAIIELVKNSKDANSDISEIHFNNLSVDKKTLAHFKVRLSHDLNLSMEKINELDINQILSMNNVHPEMILKDYGKGMTRNELKTKWLNIAFSEKKHQSDKGYAGNKGVGRFSCDRLGQILVLYTKSKNDDYLKLLIDWTLYENKGQKDEISSIPLKIEVLTQDEFEKETETTNFSSGTILRIQKLRSDWNQLKHKKLISELEKFSPSLDHGFEINFQTKNVKIIDNEKTEEISKKKFDNVILEKLSFKTIYIKSSIGEHGDFINTSLYYQGEEIYTYKAKNPFKYLSNISIEVHYLDSVSRSFFTRKVGLMANDYGSIFLFYNGFRVSPYGNDKNDWLNLDQRKAQGTSRYLGTRDVIGRIDVNDNNNTFQVITSREGLAHNKAFFDLAASDPDEKTILKNGAEEYGYAVSIIRQLESFVVDGLDWNRLVDNSGLKNVVTVADLEKDSNRFIAKELSKEKVTNVLKKIVNKSFVVDDFNINLSLISDIKKVNQNKIENYLADFHATVGDSSFAELPKKEKTAVKKVIKTLQHERDIARIEQEQAEIIADQATKEKIIVTDKLKLEEERSSFLENLLDPETTLDALITHVIQQISGGIEKDAKSILSAFYKNPDRVTKEDLIEVLEHAVIDIAAIKETANMATKANFNLKVATIKQDLFKFFKDYMSKVATKDSRWGINILFQNDNNLEFYKNFNPAEICVLFVNLIENARKAHANNFIVECSEKRVSFIDDGVGFDFERMPASDYLKKGITTTIQGSGLGLNHSVQIAKNLNAVLTIESNQTIGARINMEFK
jgi:signal transduction histidine kinase